MCHQFVMIPKEVMLEMMQHKDIDAHKAQQLSRKVEESALEHQNDRVTGTICYETEAPFEPALEFILAGEEDLYRAMAQTTF